MKKNVTLHILKPCEQSWDEMNQTATGKFCCHCNTEVIDFSKMSAVQLQAYFQTAPLKVCGRIDPLQLQQLNQDFGRREAHAGYRLPFIMMSLLALFTNARAVTSNTQPYIRSELHLNKDLALATACHMQQSSANTFVVKGQVKAEREAAPLEGVLISIPKLNLRTATDRHGKFEFSINGTVKQTINLLIVHLGYQRKEVPVVLNQGQNPLTICLAKDKFLMGEVTIMPLHKKSHSLKLDTPKAPEIEAMLVGGIIVRRHPFSFLRRAVDKVGSWFR